MGKNYGLVSLLVISFLVLLMPLSVYGTDMLVIKDLGGANTKFVVTAEGKVGLGLANPGLMFDALGAHVSGTGIARFTGSGPYGFMTADTFANSGSDESGFLLKTAGTLIGQFGVRQSDQSVYIKNRVYGSVEIVTITSAGNVGIGTTTPTHLIQLSGGAYSNGTTWVNASSREYKENIRELTASEAIDALDRLDPVKYNYKLDKEDKHVGFIAEDVPDLVATKDRKGLSPMDIVAVLTKVVQEQQKTISGLKEEMAELKKTANSEL